MEVINILKDLAAMGFTPAAIIALTLFYRLNQTLNGFDKRLALLEQTTSKCVNC